MPEFSERTIVVSSISKSHAAPGFRSGWAAGPTEFCSKLLPVSETMLIGVQPFIADMTAMALSREIPMAQTMRANSRRRARTDEHAFAGNNLDKPMPAVTRLITPLDLSANDLSEQDFAWEPPLRRKVPGQPVARSGHAPHQL